jgi:hypothetical protein
MSRSKCIAQSVGVPCTCAPDDVTPQEHEHERVLDARHAVRHAMRINLQLGAVVVGDSVRWCSRMSDRRHVRFLRGARAAIVVCVRVRVLTGTLLGGLTSDKWTSTFIGGLTSSGNQVTSTFIGGRSGSRCMGTITV